MSKFHFSVLAVLLMILVGLSVIEKAYQKSLPLINLPIQAHNTIGELPMISQIDSGGVQNITPRTSNWGYIQTNCITGMVMNYVSVSCGSVSYR